MVKKVIKRKKDKLSKKEKAIMDKAKKEIANLNKKEEKFSWFKHKVWLDGFRGKSIK
tara:strand:- start:1129 stop:1299 length:171 start_codon:yes stop_codon:yes gene_type:complete